MFAQLKAVTGVVSDFEGSLLPGASVSEKGTSNGVITDFDGAFTIEVSEGATLVVSFVGYQTQEVPVGTESTINITLQGDNTLEEVLVVGYGTQKKSDLTGSISNVSSKDFENQPIVRAEDALQSRSAGVNVSKNSGAPGGDIKIRIRGSNSITGNNQPLVVIDGIIGGDLSTLNSSDIESMSVLKDASAAAIYGSRGSNGVIMVTTKKGKSGEPQVNLNYFMSSSVVPKTYNLLNASQFVELAGAQSSIVNGGADYQDEYYQTAMTNNLQLTASGKEGRLSYYLSGNLVDQEGIIINTNYKRYALRSNLTADLTDKFTVGLNIYGAKEDSHNLIEGGSRGSQDPRGGVQAVLGWNPAVNYINEDGTYNLTSDYGSIMLNPIAVQKERDGNDVTKSFNTNLNLSYNFSEDLNFTVLAGTTQSTINSQVYNEIPDGTTILPPNSTFGSTSSETYQVSNILTWDKDFENSSLKLTGIYELQSSSVKTAGYVASQYIFTGLDDAFYFSELAESQLVNADYETSSMDSYVARAEANFGRNLYVTGTMRIDVSSIFQEGNRTGYFPSVSAAYNYGDLFLPDDSFFSKLNLRAGYGETGNQNVAPYSTYQELETGNNFPFDGSSLDIGLGFGGLVDEDLTWETTKQINVGLDFSMMKGRLNLSLDWFLKNTEDLLLEKPVLASNGGGTILTNIGEVKNSGVDLTFNAIVIDNKDLRWDSDLTMSYIKNEVVDLGGSDQIVTSAPSGVSGTENYFLLKVGESIGNFYGYEYLGADENGAAQYGDEIGIIGNGTPDFSWGWNNTLTYKNWDLNILTRGVHGYDILNSTLGTIRLATGTITVPTSAEVLDPDSPTSGTNIINSTRNIENGSFVRLSNLSLGYTISDIKGFADSVKLYLSGQNLLTITDYKGYDPEVSSGGVETSDVTPSYDSGAIPNPRTVTFGVNIGF
ncbi:SusC/RagA family TonB-linked outer membrane protein [Formosa sediminum]|nr:SusC/RagA family TonB-linked outer membrane protein [Formosa sediminum]